MIHYRNEKNFVASRALSGLREGRISDYLGLRFALQT
jgi:hypothetical protein